MTKRFTITLTMAIAQLAFGAHAGAQSRLSSGPDKSASTLAPLGIPNDQCAAATPVAIPSVTPGSTVGATPDPEAGAACGTPITVGGVWYSVIGTGTRITVTTCPSDPVQPGAANYNSKLSVFCASCDDLSCVGGNDNGCGFFTQSKFTWCSEAGVEYLVLVHGAIDAQGAFSLSIYDNGMPCTTPPDCTPTPSGACCFPEGVCFDGNEVECGDAGGFFVGPDTNCATFDCLSLTPTNDGCDGAVPVAVPSLTDGSTFFANVDLAQTCTTFIGSPGVWYTVVGTGNTITVTTCSGDPVQPGAADFDTKLSVYCGSCNTSSCCFQHDEPECDDADCQDAVCAFDPFCCNVFWDEICVAEALFTCPNVCQPVFCVTDNDDGCSTQFLTSTASWCTEPGRVYFVLVHGFGQTGDFTLSAYDGPACDEPVNCDACEFACAPGATLEDEPNCGIPADIVNGGCNSPIGFTSNCCVPGSEPGCDDFICANTVCDIDPFCCDEVWDNVCAEMALELCDACSGIVYPMEPISCGERYCSTAGGNGSMRDVDWYKLQLPEAALVEVTATAGFAALFGIIDNFGLDSCEDLEDFVSFAVSRPCEETTVGAFLPAGTWYLIIAPSTFGALECQTEYEFTVSCSNPGACCFDGGACYQRSAEACAAQGGNYQGAGTDCFTLDGGSVRFTSAPNLMIPDGDLNGVSSTLVVTESLPIAKLTVDVEITHTWIADVTVWLTHQPTGTTAYLYRSVCAGAQNLIATFDDDGGPVICAVPLSGVIAPLLASGSQLSAFQGIDAAGEWRLHMYDNTFSDAGTLVEWSINVETGTPVPCVAPLGRCCRACPADCGNGDGVVDMFDLAALLDQWGTPGACASGPDVIGFRDLLRLIGSWGTCPTECSTTTNPECGALGGQWTGGTDCSTSCTF